MANYKNTKIRIQAKKRSRTTEFIFIHHGQIQDFPEAAPTPEGERQSIIWPIFFWKLHENEENWTEGGVQNFSVQIRHSSY